MSRSSDEDVAKAIVAKWNQSAEMPAIVLGGLEQDKLSSFQPNTMPDTNPDGLIDRRRLPYATFVVDKMQDPEISTGGQYIDRRRVLIEVRGVKADVLAAIEAAATLYVQQPLTIDSDNVSGRAAMAVLEIGSDELKKEAVAKNGLQIWVGSLELMVMSHRMY